MNTRKLIQAGVVAAAALAFTSSAAMAFVPFNIEVIHKANVYANRTMSAAVVNKVDKGDIVKVMQIKISWCYIQAPGDDGWVKCENLAPFL